MRIVMMTNTYLPHVGGVARSVAAFVEAYRRHGHDVLVVAPTFEGTPSRENGMVRVPAIQKFNGSDFSVRLPRCAKRVLDIYAELIDTSPKQRVEQDNAWEQTLRLLETEWQLWASRAEAAVRAMRSDA
jgi:glycosyltransferase involved in cell wall biosynthesis